jgi:hypothetical protein
MCAYACFAMSWHLLFLRGFLHTDLGVVKTLQEGL